MKTEDLLALVNNEFLREKGMDMWRATTGERTPWRRIPMKSLCSPGSWSAY
jgi:hypothetical protein